ncbi:hypothetical protein AVEN_233449-1 [Araneus ventricosus]|uniref:Uncharacterized protein n=1 Tax=Araneus ventricosus TaxID=182803 RepID=A0A4Y2JYU6_ARAVE|nr:hypothetical protein AVEN_233449-1 [Araneus ventricosus]
MAAMQEKSFCALEYAKCSSVTSVQRGFLHWSTIVRDFLYRELNTSLDRTCWKLGECMYLFMYYPSLYVVYLEINRPFKPDESFRLTLYIFQKTQ